MYGPPRRTVNEWKVHPLVIPGTEKRCYFVPSREPPLLRRHGFYTDTSLGLDTSLSPFRPQVPHFYNERVGTEWSDILSGSEILVTHLPSSKGPLSTHRGQNMLLGHVARPPRQASPLHSVCNSLPLSSLAIPILCCLYHSDGSFFIHAIKMAANSHHELFL